jgi:hydroxymethylpyrimidine pyrophosphatase-like HAD family hydrolase
MPKTFIYAASKAREFLDSNDIRHEYEIDNVREEKIKELNLKLEELVKDPAYEIYSLIGSGLQFKFGQTTIARQDINGTVPEEESDNFLKLITTIVGDIDPEKQYFVIEDTGLDIEIILTIKSNEGEAPLKDFDKGDGIDYLSAKLNLHLDNGPHLVCGDTSSDLRMIDTLVEKTDDTWAIFVTKDNDLADETAKLCNNHFIVPEPDMLVTILNELSKGKL